MKQHETTELKKQARPALASKPDISHWNFPLDAPAVEIYLQLLEELQTHFVMIQHDAFALPQFDLYIKKTFSAFQLHSWGLFRVFLDGRVYRTSTAANSINVALVLFLYSAANAWNAQDMNSLIRAALLHDVGMLFLPQELLLKEGKLTEKERVLLESHPSISYEKIRIWGEGYEATQVGLQHHEEWNGTGYPSKLSGASIHLWARISAVAINFVARVTQRRYRNSLVGYEAMKQLIKDQGIRFDPLVVKEFVRCFGLNPPGSILLLSDGSIARVIEMTTVSLLRPQVRILIDSIGNVFRDDHGPLIDLNDTPKIFIARPVNFQDLLEAREYQAPR
jgi:HD-GYP domain-containing protein (c-di-GMP phosphodiesterase class II)